MLGVCKRVARGRGAEENVTMCKRVARGNRKVELTVTNAGHGAAKRVFLKTAGREAAWQRKVELTLTNAGHGAAKKCF